MKCSCLIWSCDCDHDDKALMDFPLMGMKKDTGACFEALTKVKKCAFTVGVYLYWEKAKAPVE